jgi:tetratricopeptide (TPR) repeat protein
MTATGNATGTRRGSEVELRLDGERVAVTALEETARRCPGYADAHHRLGLLHLARGEHAAARNEFEEALAIHPGYRAALHALRLTLRFEGATLPPASETPPEGARPRDEAVWRRVEEAYAALAEGRDPAPALSDPEGTEPLLYHHYAAVFAARLGEFATAGRHWTAAAGLSETSRELLEERGILPWRESSQAAVERTGALLWSPLAAELYAYLGRIYARNGLVAEARVCYAQAYLVLPREATHARHMAELAIAGGNEDEAIAQLRRAVEIDPVWVEARIALGFECAAQGYGDDARAQFEAAARLAPGFADVRYNLGLIYDGAGRREDALEQFRRALQINPGYLPARQSLAASLCRGGALEEGLREYERVLRQGFQSADMLVKMGRAALELGRAEEALQYLERASFVNPDYSPSYYYLGKAYQAKGLRNKAQAAWRRHLEKAGAADPATLSPPIE